jgi:hypothetical protein
MAQFMSSSCRRICEFVMPGLVPGIHVLRSAKKKDADGRDV